MPTGAIRKYYIGIAVLMLLAIGVLGYTISQSSGAKADVKTNKSVDEIAQKIDNYVADNGAPSSLSEIGVKNVPSTIAYSKLSDSKYKICIDYKTASGGFDASWSSLLGGAITGSQSTYSVAANGSYFDSFVESAHKKGENCQTISAAPSYGGFLDSSGSQSDSGCNASNQDSVNGSLTVSSVDTANQQINFSPKDQYLYDNSGNSVSNIASIKYDSKTLFCDGSSQQTDVSAISAGSNVYVYLSSVSATTADRFDSF